MRRTIVAKIATYPPRRERVLPMVRSLVNQVDRINLVLNEYDAPLPEIAGFDKIHQIIPPEDLKDTGKFFPEVPADSTVFLLDDDVEYPPDFVRLSLERRAALPAGRRYLCGYHGSLYQWPERKKKDTFWTHVKKVFGNVADNRRPLTFYKALDQATVVDQIATNSAFLEAADMPPWRWMKGSEKFVDVRLARWCFRRGITPVCLPRAAGWLNPVRFEETIFFDFTRSNPPHVAREIWRYAFRTKGRGKTL